MMLRNDGRTRPARTSPSSPEPAARNAAWTGSRRSGTLGLVTAALVLAALNLRPAISGLGPLLAEVRAALDMNGAVAGLLTSVPALCFAVFGSTAPRLARRLGPVAVLAAGMAAVTAGLGLRALAGGTGVFLSATALALAGIAVSNVLMPVIVKRYFPDRVGAMTSLYTTALALGTAAAAALTVPVADALGGSWRAGIGLWAVPGVLALVPWVLVALRDRGTGTGPPPGAAESAAVRPPAPRVARSGTAWSLALFFGLQATAAYACMGWMPQIYRDAGVTAATAGVLLATVMGMGVPLSFVLPRLAARMRHQGPLIAAMGLCGLGGYLGLWIAPAAGAWAWALLLGVSNCAFPVALTMLGLRSRTSAGVARLSAFAQSTGYLLAVPGPLVIGVWHENTGGWHGPLALLISLMVVQIAVGTVAGRDRTIEDGH